MTPLDFAKQNKSDSQKKLNHFYRLDRSFIFLVYTFILIIYIYILILYFSIRVKTHNDKAYKIVNVLYFFLFICFLKILYLILLL